jgi:hypothetical protein
MRRLCDDALAGAIGRDRAVKAGHVMTIRTRFIIGIVTLSSLGVFGPSTVVAQHGPGRHGPTRGPAYDTTTEATFTGTVADVKNGRSFWSRLVRIHTLGLGHKRVQDQQLLVKTDMEAVRVHLGPTAFLTEKKVEIRKGDTLEVTGSRVTIGDSQVVLAREIRKADQAWTLRDAAGQPLWSANQTEARGFWTTTKVLLAVIAVKVALLATVLSH